MRFLHGLPLFEAASRGLRPTQRYLFVHRSGSPDLLDSTYVKLLNDRPYRKFWYVVCTTFLAHLSTITVFGEVLNTRTKRCSVQRPRLQIFHWHSPRGRRQRPTTLPISRSQRTNSTTQSTTSRLTAVDYIVVERIPSKL